MSPNRMSEVRTSQQEIGQEKRLFSFKATQWIWLGLAMLEALIGLRVVLKLIGANPDNLFAAFIYNFSHIFLFPFEGLIPSPALNTASLELSSLIAMGVFALLALAVERIVWVVFYRPRGSVVGVTQTITSEPVTVTQTTTRDPVTALQTTARDEISE